MGALPADAVAPLGKSLGALAEGKPAPQPCALRLEAFPSVEDAEIVVVELCDTSGGVAKLAAEGRQAGDRSWASRRRRAPSART